ncbi:MAG: hypothetical protein B6I38_04060, partial [Anaerolineaceae bacterium 4572_5.1]
KIIFGADQATLAGVTLAILEERGWKLVVVESGLGGRLSHQFKKTKNAALLYSEDTQLAPGELLRYLDRRKEEQAAEAALGIAFFPGENEQSAELYLATPEMQKSRTLRYGGHPQNALRWAPNVAINILRRAAMKEK